MGGIEVLATCGSHASPRSEHEDRNGGRVPDEPPAACNGWARAHRMCRGGSVGWRSRAGLADGWYGARSLPLP